MEGPEHVAMGGGLQGTSMKPRLQASAKKTQTNTDKIPGFVGL